MHSRLIFLHSLNDKLTHHRGCTQALVDLATVKVVARKALAYAKVPVPQTDTGR